MSIVDTNTPRPALLNCDFELWLFFQTFTRLSCAYKKENQTKMVVCDLGNPMKGGTKVSDVISCCILGVLGAALTCL